MSKDQVRKELLLINAMFDVLGRKLQRLIDELTPYPWELDDAKEDRPIKAPPPGPQTKEEVFERYEDERS